MESAHLGWQYERTLARAVSSRLLTFSERKAVVLHLDEALIMLQAIKVLMDFTLLRTEVITQQWTLRQQTRTHQ